MISQSIFHGTIVLLASVYVMLKVSLKMIEKKKVIYFLPIFIFGLTFCFYAASLFFHNLNYITNTVANVFAIGFYSFYGYVIWRIWRNAH